MPSTQRKRPTRQEMRSAARASLSEWQDAVIEAERSGTWTEAEVQRTLFLSHPVIWLIFGVLALAVVSAICRLVGWS